MKTYLLPLLLTAVCSSPLALLCSGLVFPILAVPTGRASPWRLRRLLWACWTCWCPEPGPSMSWSGGGRAVLPATC